MCVTNQVIWVKYLESWAFVLSGKVYEWKLICTLCPVDLKIKRAVSDCFYADEDSVEREFGSIIEKDMIFLITAKNCQMALCDTEFCR